jgi:glycosyltransferase involved in cell wall biosynthesis
VNAAPISVVMPSYNAGRFVAEAIDSVLAQSLPPRQIIVVDDGSNDGTEARLRPYAGRIEYVFQSNQGVSAARNRGVEGSREPFVAFLDADDVWHPRKVELQMAAFRRRPELAILSAPTYDWPGPVPQFDDAEATATTDVTWDEMALKNRMNTSCVVARRDVLRRVGPFDTHLLGPEDRDMWLRIVEVAPGASLRVPLAGYRFTPGGISQNAAKCREGMLRILRKLDRRGAWGRRRLLRRAAYSHVNHACAWMYSLSGRQASALRCELAAIGWYPLPYRRADVAIPLERIRRAAVFGMRLLRLKAWDRPAEAAEAAEAAPPADVSGAAAL